jgi:tetratricopeptide (TPR) repeat protein
MAKNQSSHQKQSSRGAARGFSHIFGKFWGYIWIPASIGLFILAIHMISADPKPAETPPLVAKKVAKKVVEKITSKPAVAENVLAIKNETSAHLNPYRSDRKLAVLPNSAATKSTEKHSQLENLSSTPLRIENPIRPGTPNNKNSAPAQKTKLPSKQNKNGPSLFSPLTLLKSKNVVLVSCEEPLVKSKKLSFPESSIKLVIPQPEAEKPKQEKFVISQPKHKKRWQEIPRQEILTPTESIVQLTPCEPGYRSEQLESIARQADMHTRRGYELAGRKAFFSARSEFIRALQLTTQGLDMEHKTSFHSQSLSGGLQAIKEADDFGSEESRLASSENLKKIVSSHQTPIVEDLGDKSILIGLDLRRRYLTYAQDQLARAIGGEVAGSIALHAMGKLYAGRTTLSEKPNLAKAITFYQAALISSPRNHLVLNDLGVLLSRSGRPDDARKVFEKALTVKSSMHIWHNLAKVQRQLGNLPAARSAEQQIKLFGQTKTKTKTPPVQWVDHNEFIRSYAQSSQMSEPMPIRNAANTTGSKLAPTETARKTRSSTKQR